MSQEKVLPAFCSVPNVARGRVRYRALIHRPELQLARNTVGFWFERWKQRRALARLDDRLLADIGVTREEAYVETQKWFWQD